MSTEFERIQRLHAVFGDPCSPVTIGIGDDAAVLSLAAVAHTGQALAWTIDCCVENVHFRRDIVSWSDVGWRSLMAAASDLAAMGSRPLGALCNLILPSDITDAQLDEIALGQAHASRVLGIAVVGGNLSRGTEVSVTTTLLGSATRVPLRRGAQPGDWVIVAGELGVAAAGLRLLLESGDASSGFDSDELHAVQAWRRPVALVEEGLQCAQTASSLIDVSDGLAQDASHVATASGVRVDLDSEPLVTDALARVCVRHSWSAVDLALHGGEDYALLGTVPAGHVPAGFRVIGRCTEGQGVWLRGSDLPLDAFGHDHFARRKSSG